MPTMKPEKLNEKKRELKKSKKPKKDFDDQENNDFNEGFLSIFNLERSSKFIGVSGNGEEEDGDEDGGDMDGDGGEGEDDDDDDDDDEAVDSPGGFLEWIFGWIINPIAAIINGIIQLVTFIIQLIGFIINFGDCWPYYFLYFGSILLYFPLSMFFMVFGLSKIEVLLFKARDTFHDFLMCLGLPLTGLHNSDEIRKKCFFESGVGRVCPSGDMDIMKQLKDLNPFKDKDKFKFDFVSVLSLLTTFTLVSLIIYYVVKNYLWPFIKSLLVKKEDVAKKAE
jgi:hypothetical protein